MDSKRHYHWLFASIVFGGTAFPPCTVSAESPGVYESAPLALVLGRTQAASLAVASKTAVPVSQLRGRVAVFVENQGQWDSHAKFRLDAGGKTIWLGDSRIVFDVAHERKAADPSLPTNRKGAAARALRKNADAAVTAGKLERLAFSEEWIGASTPSWVEPIDPQPGTYNYFVGNDKARWHTSIHGYGGVIYHDVWKGVDVRLVSKGADVEQEFLVRAGVDTSKIQMAYRGIESLVIADDGSLLVHTAFGDLRETNPLIYQEIEGRRVRVAGHFRLTGKAAFAFDVEGYNPKYAVVIDPTLLYSTYLGGNGGGSCNVGCGSSDEATSIAVDQSGSAYVTGVSGSTNWPTTVGAYYTANTNGVFVTKLSPLGDKLVYSTFLAVGTQGYGIAVDRSGEAYVTGTGQFVGLGEFPTTPNAFQQTRPSQFYAFVTKLSSAGDSLIYSTFLGGSSTPQGIALDASGRAYVAGFSSGGHPTTPGAFQPTIISSASRSGFLSVLDPSTSSAASLVYSTYLGGSFGDAANAVAVDSFGMAYLAGVAASADFPVTAGAYQTTLNNATSGGYDAFVAKLNPNAAGPASLIYATFVGGTGYSDALGIAVDALGNAYFTGWAQSGTFPISGGPFPNLLNDSGVIAKLNTAGNKLVYSSFLGSAGSVFGTAIAADSAGNAYVTGYLDCRNTGIQTTPDAFQKTCNGVIGTNAFVMKIDPTGVLIYSSYLGGISPASGFGDQALGIAIDATGDAYVTGFTASPVFPTTPFAFQPALNPGFIGSQQFPADAFVTKFPLGLSSTLSVSALVPSAGGNSGAVTVQIFGTGFHAGAIAQLNCPGHAAIVGTNLVVGSGGRFLNTTFNLAAALPEACDVVVTNADGGSATLSQSFVVQQGGAPNIRVYLTGVEARKVPAEVALGPADAIVFATASNTGNVDSKAFLVSEPVAPPFSLTSVNPPGVASLATLTADSQALWSVPIAAGSSQLFALTAATPSSSPNTILASTVTTPDQVAFAQCLADNFSFGSLCPSIADIPVRFDCNFAATFCADGDPSCTKYIHQCQEDLAHCNAPAALVEETSCGLQTVSPLPQVGPADPNGIVGPSGVGSQGWTPGPQRLTYAISFNNEPTATAPAQQVTVTEPLGPYVDVSTLTLPIITVPNAGTDVHVPVPLSSFNPAVNANEFKTNLDLRPNQNILVAVDALVNPGLQTLTWIFTTIDPTTGMPPLNPLVGFLPPGAGASVSFSATPKRGLATGNQIVEQGTIVFDGQSPMSTLEWINTIDNTPPISHVTALPSAETSINFAVVWSGTDVGAGIQDYTIYASDSGAPFTAFQTNVTSTSAIYAGQVGHTYGFYSVARDLVGNVEAKTAAAESTTTVVTGTSTTITSAASATFQTGAAGSFTVTTTGVPVATISESGALPVGVQFVDNHNGTATLSGTPTTAGTFPLMLSATNGVGTATQAFTLTVTQGSTKHCKEDDDDCRHHRDRDDRDDRDKHDRDYDNRDHHRR